MKRFLFSLWLGTVITSHAASWYLDNAATGGNAGTSWTDAWTGFSSVVWGASGVNTGDTLFISGGSTSKKYTATTNYFLDFTTTGVTIRPGQDSGHNGIAIIDGANAYGALIRFPTDTVINGEYSGAIHLWLTNTANTQDNNACMTTGDDFVLRYTLISGANIGLVATGGSGGTVEWCQFQDIREQAAIRLNGRNTGATSYDLTFVQNNVIQLNNDGMTGDGNGPDGIQGCTGLTLRSNLIYAADGDLGPFPNHTDFLQGQAMYVKVYANDFLNITDSAVDFDGEISGLSGNVRIYNNLFRMTYTAGVPSGIRIYSTYGPITAFTNIWIMNNTFVDLAMATVGGYPVSFGFNSGNPTVNDVTIKNNLFFNSGKAGTRVLVNIPASTAAVAADWNVDYNLTSAGAQGETAMTVDGASFTQSNPRTGTPVFESYSEGSAGNDLHLDTSDTAATGQGVDLSAFITTDKDGLTRDDPWDIGAYKANPGAATEFYASPTGSAANNGLSTNNPWPLHYAIQNAGVSNTVWVMDGVYDNAGGQAFEISTRNYRTVRAMNKWRAVLANATNDGFIFWDARGNTIDGLCISNAGGEGIRISGWYNTITNCWITDNGHHGILSGTAGNSNNTITACLIEKAQHGIYNATNAEHGYGIYISGPSNVIENCVFRYNAWYGLHYYTGVEGMQQWWTRISGNLTYGHTNKYGMTVWGARGDDNSNPGTNFIFGNTITDGLELAYGTAWVTNNIILPSPAAPTLPINNLVSYAATVRADYNLGTNTITPAGSGDVITTYSSLGFSGPGAGRYWLSSTSSARGEALTTCFAPVNFFGNAQASVTDIGAFQYSAKWAADTRILDPSPVAGSDYWGEPVGSRIWNVGTLILR